MKKFKISALLITCLMTISLFAGCTSSNNTSNSKSTDNSLQKVKDAGKFTIGLDDSYPPMEFRDDKSNLVGFDIDLGNALAKKIGVKLEVTTTDFNGIVLALKSGKFDAIISSLSMTQERKKEIDFVGPYVDGGQIIVTRKNDDSIKTKSDLKGKILSAQLGSTGDQAAKKVEGAKTVKEYDKVTEAFHDLAIGRTDALIVDGQVGGYYVKKDSDKYKILNERLTKEPIGIGIKKEDKELKKSLQKALDELKSDGTLSKLSIKWFGYDIYKMK
ncbi:amino acid ABC transporter substrate-binding protein [Clostridium fermenticellae]|uniref:Amino acid ABC transporter substrate-binding protein n=1 Tax=Clostridium fermenticellae TaxID=2068654 RepID=A0A386H4B4_9CLOT|nr:transporter substrate-binding domain-containing protein [Clostridium fermenticellae]AYD40325.1 amino acid ABC transporter substrate-binding protein [Clostridium fermenticellae]